MDTLKIKTDYSSPSMEILHYFIEDVLCGSPNPKTDTELVEEDTNI